MTNKILVASIIAGLAAIMAVSVGIAHAGGTYDQPSGLCDYFADNDIFGTTGSDTLTGTIDTDCVESFGGNDKIQTGDSADAIFPGEGADRVTTGNGNDYIDLQNSPYESLPDGDIDRVMCGEGDDFVYHADDDDIFRGCEHVSYGP
jgi:Ca2+-binding RTX toxin-like protein